MVEKLQYTAEYHSHIGNTLNDLIDEVDELLERIDELESNQQSSNNVGEKEKV